MQEIGIGAGPGSGEGWGPGWLPLLAGGLGLQGSLDEGGGKPSRVVVVGADEDQRAGTWPPGQGRSLNRRAVYTKIDQELRTIETLATRSRR